MSLENPLSELKPRGIDTIYVEEGTPNPIDPVHLISFLTLLNSISGEA